MATKEETKTCGIIISDFSLRKGENTRIGYKVKTEEKEIRGIHVFNH